MIKSSYNDLHGLPVTLRMPRVKSIAFIKPFKTGMSLDPGQRSRVLVLGPLGTRMAPRSLACVAGVIRERASGGGAAIFIRDFKIQDATALRRGRK